MGGSLSCRRRDPGVTPPTPILQVRVFGLEGSGKKAVVRFLMRGVPSLEATEGDVDSDMQWVTHRKVKMLLWLSENSVQKEIANEGEVARALVYIVDGSEPEKLTAAKEYLQHQLEHTAGAPNLLILLNKCDKHSFIFLEEAHDALELDKIRDRHVRIYACSAATGEGIREGLDWLCSMFQLEKGTYISRTDFTDASVRMVFIALSRLVAICVFVYGSSWNLCHVCDGANIRLSGTALHTTAGHLDCIKFVNQLASLPSGYTSRRDKRQWKTKYGNQGHSDGTLISNIAFVPGRGADGDSLYGRKPKLDKIETGEQWIPRLNRRLYSLGDDGMDKELDEITGLDNREQGDLSGLDNKQLDNITGLDDEKDIIVELVDGSTDDMAIDNREDIIKDDKRYLQTLKRLSKVSIADSKMYNDLRKMIDAKKEEKKTKYPKHKYRNKHQSTKHKPGSNDSKIPGNWVPYIRMKGTDMKQAVKEYENLYKQTEKLQQSSDEKDREKHTFIQTNMEDIKELYPVRHVGETTGLTSEEIIEEIRAQLPEEPRATKMLDLLYVYLRLVKAGIVEAMDEAGLFNRRNYTNVTKKCMKILEKEEKCGYKFPIAGTPDEWYNDPNVYKSWGRTELYLTQHMKEPTTTRGPVEPRTYSFEEQILTNDKKQDMHNVEAKLDEIRVKRLEENLEKTLNATGVYKGDTSTGSTHVKHKFNIGESPLKTVMVSGERQRQLELLLSLNPYNPWDLYKRMKRTREVPIIDKTIELTYNINDVGVKVNFDNDYKDNLGGTTRDQFLRDYLHYFLMLPEDHKILKEFTHAQYLHDILEYFDVQNRPDRTWKPDVVSLTSRFFTFLFPSSEGFPKNTAVSSFEKTKSLDYSALSHRVNVLNAIVALLKSQKLVKEYTADIFTEQRFKTMLGTIERALEIEIKRLQLGIVDIQVPSIDAQFCAVDDVLLASLSASLSAWNIIHGIEGIVDAIIVLTTALRKEMHAKYLVAIGVNLANLHKLPRTVFQKFVNTLAEQVHERMSQDIAMLAIDPNHERWMDFDTAVQCTGLFAQYKHCLTKEFMTKFMTLYKNDYMNMRIPDIKDVEISPTFPYGYQNYITYESPKKEEDLPIDAHNSGKRHMTSGFRKSSKKDEDEYHPDLHYLPTPEENPYLNTENIHTVQSHHTTAPSDHDRWKFIGDISQDDDHEEFDRLVQRFEDRNYLRIDRQIKIQAVRGRYFQYIWSLLACLSWCDMITQNSELVQHLTAKGALGEFEMHSASALAVLQTITPKTEEEHNLLTKAYAAIINAKWTIRLENWFEIMNHYCEAVSPRENGMPPRIKPDKGFVYRMFYNFVRLRSPNPRLLKDAVNIMVRFRDVLSKGQLHMLFNQICEGITDYSCVQLQGLNAEALSYPIWVITFVLTKAADCGIRPDATWEVYLGLLKRFKHTLSLEDIKDVLVAIKMANYTMLDEIGDILMCRACNVVEVTPHVDIHLLCDIMDLALSMSIPPTKLIRWYLYLQFHDIPQSDMDRLARDMISGRCDYEVDFQGWKRPRRYLDHSVTDKDSVIVPVGLEGNEEYHPGDEMKYVMRRIFKDPPPYSGEIKQRNYKLPPDILKRLQKIVRTLLSRRYKLTSGDIALFRIAGVIPPDMEDHTGDTRVEANVAKIATLQGDDFIE
ncbi:ADP-ribosylation factor [Babesia ovis]|uniref:ADP-ribosylation factor n=1 Tax=Babesia ovis TaxID=5869 RepID=A0A9W5WU93_BABOV|nr:ADP-ribosylation factor [Babesia ovis]